MVSEQCSTMDRLGKVFPTVQFPSSLVLVITNEHPKNGGRLPLTGHLEGPRPSWMGSNSSLPQCPVKKKWEERSQYGTPGSTRKNRRQKKHRCRGRKIPDKQDRDEMEAIKLQ